MFFKSILASKCIKIIFFLVFFYIFDNILKPLKKKMSIDLMFFQAMRTFETQFQTQYPTGMKCHAGNKRQSSFLALPLLILSSSISDSLHGYLPAKSI